MVKVSLNYPVTYFLNHPIACFPKIQSPFTKSCSSKWQQNVAGGSFIKNHRNLHFKLTLSKSIKYFIWKYITKLLYLQQICISSYYWRTAKNAAPRFVFLFWRNPTCCYYLKSRKSTYFQCELTAFHSNKQKYGIQHKIRFAGRPKMNVFISAFRTISPNFEKSL